MIFVAIKIDTPAPPSNVWIGWTLASLIGTTFGAVSVSSYRFSRMFNAKVAMPEALHLLATEQ